MHNLLANMKIAFTYTDASIVRKIITTFIRPALEYAYVAWISYKQKDLMKIERLRKAATRWVPELRELSIKPSPTRSKKKKGALITLYKCTTGIIYSI